MKSTDHTNAKQPCKRLNFAITDHEKKAKYIYVQLNDHLKFYQILWCSIPKNPAEKKGIEKLVKQ